AYDYAYRYATSEYMKILEKTGEGHGHNYSYAGFNSLAHLSSNIIRNFLDLASKMYISAFNSINEDVKLIPLKIQNNEIETYSVLKIGVSNSYFHRSAKSNKTGTGRAKLYVLNRMLAPLYRLDPVSFSGYLFLRADKIEMAMNRPNDFIKYIEERIKKGNKEQ